MARGTWNGDSWLWNDPCLSWDGVECTPQQSGQEASGRGGNVRPAPRPVVMPNALTRAAQGEWN